MLREGCMTVNRPTGRSFLVWRGIAVALSHRTTVQRWPFLELAAAPLLVPPCLTFVREFNFWRQSIQVKRVTRPFVIGADP
jgi:hypothetical protein